MIKLIEVLNYRCLHYLNQRLGGFHLLVGPNASGKTTFLDAIGLLRDIVAEGLEEALKERTSNFSDLVWRHLDKAIEVAVEVDIPPHLATRLDGHSFDTVRYEIGIELDRSTHEVQITSEQGFLKRRDETEPEEQSLFPQSVVAPNSVLTRRGSRRTRRLFSKTPGGNDNYMSEAHPEQGRWRPAFKLGPRQSTLANLPEDETNFPVSTWLKRYISGGVERIVLNSRQMRLPSPPGQGSGFRSDGSNLPWVVAELKKQSEPRFREWILHLQTALPDLVDLQTIVREEDRHCWLKLVYKGGLEVPSWMASDGTLRLLALTLLAYLARVEGVYLVEEPENGIHPLAIEAAFDSLSSVYNAQILLATHSPVILGVAELKHVLCFAKSPEGATNVVSGDRHPRLKDWQGKLDLGSLFASGVLG